MWLHYPILAKEDPPQIPEELVTYYSYGYRHEAILQHGRLGVTLEIHEESKVGFVH